MSNHSNTSSPSILVIGSNGRMGIQLIRAASRHRSHPLVHAFCRTPSKLPKNDVALCASVQKGDARSSSDITRALSDTKATHIVIAIGVPDSTKKTDIRHASAVAVMDAVAPGRPHDHVRVVAVSSTGAGGTKMEVGMGIGLVLQWHLRHVMADHNLQEEELLGRMGDEWKERLMILRPTALGDGKPKGFGRVVLFDKTKKAPAIVIDREDLAEWIIREVCSEKARFGTTFSITSK